MLLPISASHAHSLANLRKTPDEVVAEIARIRSLRDSSGALADRNSINNLSVNCRLLCVVP